MGAFPGHPKFTHRDTASPCRSQAINTGGMDKITTSSLARQLAQPMQLKSNMGTHAKLHTMLASACVTKHSLHI